jgi:sugar phosphate isomerase/epimerase
MYKNIDLTSLGISSITSDVIESLLTNNIKSINFDLAWLLEQAQSQGVDKARRLIDSARLKLGVFHLPFSLDAAPDEFVAQLASAKESAELAKSFGCTRAVANLAPASDARPYHENFGFYGNRIREVVAWLEPLGMSLGLGILAPEHYRADHTYAFIQKFDQLLLLLKMSGVPHVGVHLDVWHWHLGGGTLEHLAGLNGEQITAVTLADCPAETTAANATDDARWLPGEVGTIDSAAVVTLLKEKGYSGPITPSVAASRVLHLGRDKSIREASGALDKVFAAAGINLPGVRRPAVVGK